MKTLPSALVVVLVALTACGSSTSPPTVSTLQNDGYTGSGAVFQGGFVTGEAGAAVLGPQTKAFTLRKVLFLFGGAATAQTVTLTIYTDVGTDPPGASLYSHDYALTPSDAALQTIDLTAQNITVAAGQTIRVAVLFQHSGAPSIARDGDGITASRNFIFSSPTWSKSETLGVTGDWIIRAEIATN